jgi:virginiamycin B lyase
MQRKNVAAVIAVMLLFGPLAAPAAAYETKVFDLPNKSYVHDVSPAPGGLIWYTAQREGALGILDPKTGAVRLVKLGEGSAPHGVIMGKDGNAWITDGGLNAIVRFDPKTEEVKVWRLPEDSGYANLNTSAFDGDGNLWFTGQAGIYGRLDVAKGEVKVWDAPKGRGPYGITRTPNGEVWYVSFAGSYLGKIDRKTGNVTVIEPPHANSGTRRVWSDSKGDLWISEWNTGYLDRYSPKSGQWKGWHVPGGKPQSYAVYVDDRDVVWVSHWGSNAVYSFDPKTEKFTAVPGSAPNANVRQILGRPGEIWVPESGTSRIMRVRTGENAGE